MKNTTYSLSAQATYVFIGKSASFVLAIFIPIILVRIFSKDNYGVYQQMLLVSMFLIDTIKWGLINSLYYFYPFEKEKRTQLLSQTFYLLVIAGIILVPFLYLFRYFIADLFNSQIITTLIFPICFYSFFMLTSLILDSLFILEKKSRSVVIYEITNKTLRGLFVIGTAIVFKDIYYVLWSLTIFAFIRLLFLYIYMKMNYRIKLRKIEIPLLKSQLRYAFPIGSARMAGEIGKKIDRFILAAFLTPAHYAAYSIAYFGIPFMSLFYMSVGQVIIPQMTIENKEQNLAEVKRLWHKMIDQFSVITIPIVILIEMLATTIITLLFTDQYIESVLVYRILLLLSFQRMINPSVVLRACKKTNIIFKTHLYSAILSVILSYIFIKKFGLIGGAFSVVFSSYFRLIMRIYYVKSMLTLRLNDLFPWKNIYRILVCVFFSTIVLLLITGGSFEVNVNLIYGIIVYVIILLFFLTHFKYISINQFKIIWNGHSA